MAFTNTSAALRQTGGLIVQRLSQGLQENNSIASGDLDSSIAINIKITDKKIELNITMLDYWEEIDQGQKAGIVVEPSDIEKWLTYPNVKTKMENRGFTISDPPAAPLARNIANRLTKDGRKGNNFATNVFTSSLITNELPEVIQNAIVEDADLILADLLDSFS
jgi:hypothetical protein